MAERESENHGQLTLEQNSKPLDANSYATKKTIAQGMLDIALLTANASQLKYVLQIGHQHEFYTLMLWLISVSIVLQVVSCTLALVLMTLNINKPERQHVASVLNHVVVGFVLVAMVADVIKMSFGLDPGPVQKRSADENQ
ncbi:ninjurin-2 isoform X5 [Zootermopsis nevadensis]|uniref:ninjurin-2 isoform X5 n=1 Tax=Zootermopsis nevadensis TaxID=136037 RepID=UPI000B8EBD18|nr:ninjurin-2 isoform X5 [Zootermopsis nevadensis]